MRSSKRLWDTRLRKLPATKHRQRQPQRHRPRGRRVRHGQRTPSGNAELDGLLAISAGRNLNANAAAIANGSASGATVLQAKNDLTLGTVAEQQ
jgi:hypothetical protein